MGNRLHYTMCGLDHVYLIDGFRHEETPRGRRLHIENQEELHKAIGAYLLRQSRGLTGRELRFLREEINLSQVNLARLLGESDQSVARREKRDAPFKRPPTQERILRFLYDEKVLQRDETLSDFLQELANADNVSEENVAFEPEEGGWRQAA